MSGTALFLYVNITLVSTLDMLKTSQPTKTGKDLHLVFKETSFFCGFESWFTFIYFILLNAYMCILAFIFMWIDPFEMLNIGTKINLRTLKLP